LMALMILCVQSRHCLRYSNETARMKDIVLEQNKNLKTTLII